MVGTLVIGAATGLIVGILSGLFGIGGGTVMIPMMRLLLSVPALMTTGTSLFVILPTSITSAVGRYRQGNLNIKLGVCAGLGGMLFSPLGSWLAELAGGPASMIAAAIIIGYTAFTMIRGALKLAKPDASNSTSAEASASDNASKKADAIATEQVQFVDAKSISVRGVNLIKILALGAVAGFCSGFIGVGGGFLIVPMLMWIFKVSFKDASSASVCAMCLLCIPGIITHGHFGHIDYLMGVMLALGSIPGSFLGNYLVTKVRERPLRIAFGIFLFFTAALLAINELVL